MHVLLQKGMGKQKKRRGSSSQDPEPVRKSSRMSKPSQRLVDFDSEFNHNSDTSSNQHNEFQVGENSPVIQSSSTDGKKKSSSTNGKKQSSSTEGKLSSTTDERIKFLERQLAEIKEQMNQDSQNEILEEVSDEEETGSVNHFKIPHRQHSGSKVSFDNNMNQQIDDAIPGTSQGFRSTSDNAAQDVLAKALQKIFVPEDDSVSEGEETYSSFLQLGATLDLKIKTKIWAREYVDLTQMNTKEDPSVSVSIQNNGQPAISLKSSKSAPPNSFYNWLPMFATYAAVYLEKYPSEGSSLITYMMKIMDLSRKYHGYGWRLYDEKFRKVRAKVNIPWHVMKTELLLDCVSSPNLQGQNKNTKKQPFRSETSFRVNNQHQDDTYRSPRGVCFTYDKFGRCTNPYKPCKYLHKCTKCDKEGHHRSICRQNSITSSNSSSELPGHLKKAGN